jgi:uncharacterized membrane protein
MNILLNHRYALMLGIALALILAIFIGGFEFNHIALSRWIHVVAGVFWIGLLYYFNVAQIPALADAAADKGGPGGAAIWLAGAGILERNLLNAFALGSTVEGGSYYFLVIGIGAWLGTIMLFNVWVLIWPNQKKVLGLTPATDEEKAKARKTAMLASRTNFVLSIPMLLCMGAAGHGMPF